MEGRPLPLLAAVVSLTNVDVNACVLSHRAWQWYTAGCVGDRSPEVVEAKRKLLSSGGGVRSGRVVIDFKIEACSSGQKYYSVGVVTPLARIENSYIGQDEHVRVQPLPSLCPPDHELQWADVLALLIWISAVCHILCAMYCVTMWLGGA